MSALVHSAEHCTGNWRLVGGDPARRLISCDKCRHALDYTPELKLEAINNNYAGIYLRRLTNEGAEALEAERRPPWES